MFKDRYDVVSSLKVVGFILVLTLVYAFISNDDYHKMFDKPQGIMYNCDMLIGSWHPDIPQKVIEECRKRKI
jgi:hypothetical protein